MSALLFSSFDVSRQAFYRSGLAAAIVNLKPIVPGRTFISFSSRDSKLIPILGLVFLGAPFRD